MVCELREQTTFWFWKMESLGKKMTAHGRKKKAHIENKTRAFWGGRARGRASRARRLPSKIKRVTGQFRGHRKNCGFANTIVSKTEN